MSKTQNIMEQKVSELALVLPEIVSHIMLFLSHGDLLTCTLVCKIWEYEARKLLHLKEVVLSATELGRYMVVMNVRGNCHESVNLQDHAYDENVYQMCKSFAERYAIKVRKLSTEWYITSVTEGRRYLELLKMFTTLHTLKLKIERVAVNEQELMEIFAENVSFPYVTVLRLFCDRWGENNDAANAKFSPVISHVMELFPNITELKCQVWSPCLKKIVENPEMFKNLNFLSVVNVRRDSNFEMIKILPINLTRIQFNFPGDRVTQWTMVLNKFASTLKHLRIARVRITSGEKPLELPIMPKLRILRIDTIWPTHEESYRHRFLSQQRSIRSVFKFETANSVTGQGINYSVQFPSLAVLKILGKTIHYRQFEFDSTILISKQDYFDAFLHLLYAFLPLNVEPCITLRYLDIPTPSIRKCRCRNTNTNNWELEEDARFYERVLNTFPTIGPKWVEQYRQKQRDVKMEHFMNLGVELGILEKVENNSESNNIPPLCEQLTFDLGKGVINQVWVRGLGIVSSDKMTHAESTFITGDTKSN